MFNVKFQRKILASASSYAEARAKAMTFAKKYSGQELLIDKKVFTEYGVDLGWENVGSLRCCL